MNRSLGRYREYVDSALWGWNNAWPKPSFRDWAIKAELDSINCPLLALQGIDEEYGTLEQVYGIKRKLAHCEVAELPGCGHSAHRDQADEVIRIVSDFMPGQQQAALRQQVSA